VYPSTSGPDGVTLLTADGVSQAVSAPEIIITLVLFTLVYTFIFIALIREVFKLIKKGPVLEPADGMMTGTGSEDEESDTPVSAFNMAQHEQLDSSRSDAKTDSHSAKEGE